MHLNESNIIIHYYCCLYLYSIDQSIHEITIQIVLSSVLIVFPLYFGRLVSQPFYMQINDLITFHKTIFVFVLSPCHFRFKFRACVCA